MFSITAFAQMSRKPSPSREPKGAMSKTPDLDKRSLPQIKSREDFDSIARVYHQGTSYSLPHVMFAIDRRNKNKIYSSIRKNIAFTKIFCWQII